FVRGTMGGHTWSAIEIGARTEVQLDGTRLTVHLIGADAPNERADAGAAVAPMPGIVSAVPVQVGSVVAEGDVVAVVEAMKMENQVLASTPGVVTEVHFPLGATV